MAEFTIPDGFLSVQRCGRREQCTRDAKRIVELEARVAEYLTTIANQDRLVDAQEADIKKLEGRVAELVFERDGHEQWADYYRARWLGETIVRRPDVPLYVLGKQP